MRFGAEHILTLLEQELDNLPDQKNEHRQHLAELGYIPPLLLNVINNNQVVNAQQLFLNDALASGLFSSRKIEQYRLQGEQQLLTYLLRSAVDLDNGIQFSALPAPKKVSLQSRIVHYRLNLLGFWDHLIETPYSILNSELQLNELAQIVNASPIETLNLLGDLDRFANHLLATNNEEKFIVCFKASQISAEIEKTYDRRFAFKRQLIEDFGERTDFFRYLNQHILLANDFKIDFDFLEKQSKDKFSRFVMRLIQVFQWKNGFYNGLLDNRFGTLTLESFSQTIEGFKQLNENNIQPHRLLTAVANNYFLFNALFFLQEMASNQDIEDSEGNFLTNLLSNYKNADEQSRFLFDQNFQSLKGGIEHRNSQTPERNGILQRIYYGLSSFYKKAMRFSKRIFRWIVVQTKKLSGFLTSLFSSIFENLREALVTFISGYRFLLGKNGFLQTSETGLLISTLRLFGDSYTISTGNNSELIPLQIYQLKNTTRSIHFALTLTCGVLKIIIASINFIGWPFILISTLSVYRELNENYKLKPQLTV